MRPARLPLVAMLSITAKAQILKNWQMPGYKGGEDTTINNCFIFNTLF